LVHRKPAQAVRIALTPERALLGPGEQQTLRVRTTDESGAPRSAVLGLSVFDHALADVAEQPGLMKQVLAVLRRRRPRARRRVDLGRARRWRFCGGDRSIARSARRAALRGERRIGRQR